MEFIGTFRQVLNSAHVLDLDEILYVPFFRRNLISVFRLLLFGYVAILTILVMVLI